MIDSGTGLDLNSVLTVARVSANTLRVRLGAMQQGSTEYAMIPRTHNVTVLVMLPPGAAGYLQLMARTTMVDVHTGAALPDRTSEEVETLLAEVGVRYGVPDTSLLAELLDFAQQNDTKSFFEAVPDGVSHPKGLWVDLVRVRIGSQWETTVVDLGLAAAKPVGKKKPETMTADLPLDQAITLEDNGTECTATLSGGTGHTVSGASGLKGWLIIAGGKRIPADKVVIDGDRIKLVFRSIRSRSAEETQGVHVHLESGDKIAKYRRVTR